MATKSPTFIVKAWNLFKSDEENIRSSYNSLKTLDIAHERIHQGRMFRHTEVHSLAAAGVYNHLIIPNSGSDNHLQSVAVKADQGIVHIGIYENPFTDANSLGVLDTDEWLNQNRSSINVPDFVAYENVYVNVNSLGIKISEDLVTDTSKDAGGAEEGVPYEIMFNSTKTYLIQVTNNAGAAIATVDKFSIYDGKD